MNRTFLLRFANSTAAGQARFREAWELQHLLFSLGYSDGLVPEAEIVAAVEVARSDWMPDEGAA